MSTNRPTMRRKPRNPNTEESIMMSLWFRDMVKSAGDKRSVSSAKLLELEVVAGVPVAEPVMYDNLWAVEDMVENYSRKFWCSIQGMDVDVRDGDLKELQAGTIVDQANGEVLLFSKKLSLRNIICGKAVS